MIVYALKKGNTRTVAHGQCCVADGINLRPVGCAKVSRVQKCINEIATGTVKHSDADNGQSLLNIITMLHCDPMKGGGMNGIAG